MTIMTAFEIDDVIIPFQQPLTLKLKLDDGCYVGKGWPGQGVLLKGGQVVGLMRWLPSPSHAVSAGDNVTTVSAAAVSQSSTPITHPGLLVVQVSTTGRPPDQGSLGISSGEGDDDVLDEGAAQVAGCEDSVDDGSDDDASSVDQCRQGVTTRGAAKAARPAKQVLQQRCRGLVGNANVTAGNGCGGKDEGAGCPEASHCARPARSYKQMVRGLD
jgi:hypothetical protein